MSAAAVKIIGLFYKIPLIKLIGVGGMAYFLAAYHIYTLFFTLFAAGFPVAVSILVSANRAGYDISAAEKTYKTALFLFTALGGASTAALYFGAVPIASFIEIPEAAGSIRAVAPAMLFAASGSAVKGWFQGNRDMKPTAVSQVMESAGKTCFGLLFTYLSVKNGDPGPVTAAYAISGMTVGVVVSTLYLFIIRLVKRPRLGTARIKDGNSYGKILKRLVSVSLPITLGALVINLSGIADTALISSRLQHIGYAPSVANSVYSSYGNLAIPLFNLVPAFVSPIAVAAAPMITEAAGKRERIRERELMSSSLRLCSVIAIPASIGIGVFGREILSLVFSDETAAVGVAAPLLEVLAPAIFFSCVITVTNSALQAYGHASLPVVSMAAGAAVKIISEFLLVGIPDVNITGAPVSTLLCDLTVTVLNLIFIKKYTCGIGAFGAVFVKPLVAAVAAMAFTVPVASLLTLKFPGEKMMIFPVIVIDAVLFALFAGISGTVTRDDAEVLPKGEKIAGFLKKIKLLR